MIDYVFPEGTLIVNVSLKDIHSVIFAVQYLTNQNRKFIVYTDPKCGWVVVFSPELDKTPQELSEIFNAEQKITN